MKTLLIVYHSRTGATQQVAEAAAAGAGGEEGVQVTLLRAHEAQTGDVLGADGYLFASPENLAAMSGLMKDFFDRTYYGALDCLNGRPYAVIICAGSDGTSAARQIVRIATGWRLRSIAEPLIINSGAQTPQSILAPKHLSAVTLNPCGELGAALAAGLNLGIF